MKDGKMTGFEADMIEEFAKRKGIEIEYKSAPFATVLTGVQSGQWDVAMSSIWVKKERMEVMDFADPYYDAQIGLMFPKAKPIAKFEEMKGKVFGSDTGSANESWLKEAMPKYGPYEMKSYDYWIDAVKDMEAGRIAGVVVDAPIALEYIKNNPDSSLDMLYIDDYHFAQSLAFKKGSVLRDAFNVVENEMKKDGTLKAIHVKWFGAEPLPDSSTLNVVAPYLPNEKPAVK
jgi:polar amino acid transport system substrate-binding protein